MGQVAYSIREARRIAVSLHGVVGRDRRGIRGRIGRDAAVVVAATFVLGALTPVLPAQAFSSSTPPPSPPSVNAGGYMTCGIRADLVNPANHRTAACWGDNVNEGPGQATPPTGVKFSEVNAGYSHACGVRRAGDDPDLDRTAVCWGSSVNNGSSPPVGIKFSHVAPGFVYTCGLREDKAVAANDKTAMCWGADDAGQVRNVPAGVKFTQLTVGIRHACGLRETPVNGNNIVCWGYDGNGQVANVPAGTFVALNSGNFDICALTSGGTPVCWGRNAAGQNTPPAGETFTQISAGFQHICGLRANGTILCWGRNTELQAVAPAGTFNNVSAGTFHSCAMGTDGKAVCWGNNAAGRVTPTMTSRAPLQAAVVGADYSHQFTSTYMSPVIWSVTQGALPPGLALNPGTGLLSGRPTQQGRYADIRVTASNGLASVSEIFSIEVSGGDAGALAPTVSIGDATVYEGASGTRKLAISVSLSAPSTTPVTVDYSTFDGTATAVSDYQAKAGTLTFNPGIVSLLVKVPVTGEAIDESDESFAVSVVSATGAAVGDATGLGTIVDDDPGKGRSLTVGNVSVHEGDQGTRTAMFKVTLSKPGFETITVDFTTVDGTAVAGADYTATSGTLSFAPGAVEASVKVIINPDNTTEGNETFTIGLSAASGATIANANGVGTIIDEDGLV